MNFFLFGMKYRDSATEAPAAGGGTTTVATPAGDSSAQTDDWGELSSDSDEGGSDDFSAAGDTPAAPATAAPTTPATVATPAPVPAPATPAAPAVTTPVEPAPAEPAQPAATAEAAPDIPALRAKFQSELETYYAIDPQTAAQLQTEPELVMPKLAAKVHMEVLDAVMAQMPGRVMSLIQQREEYVKRETEAENAMFSAYPELKPHREALLKVGAMFRTANPKATREQTIKGIGDFMMTSLGLTRQAAATPTAPAPPNPFIPAAGGGGGAPAPQPGEWDFVLDNDT